MMPKENLYEVTVQNNKTNFATYHIESKTMPQAIHKGEELAREAGATNPKVSYCRLLAYNIIVAD